MSDLKGPLIIRTPNYGLITQCVSTWRIKPTRSSLLKTTSSNPKQLHAAIVAHLKITALQNQQAY